MSKQRRGNTLKQFQIGEAHVQFVVEKELN